MNINCPLCNQLLSIADAEGPHVQCPHCAGVIDISACADAASQPEDPAEPEFPSEDSTPQGGVHTRLRQQTRQRVSQTFLLVGALGLMLGIGAIVAVVMISLAPKEEVVPLPAPVAKVHELVAERFPRDARFADADYQVTKTGGNEWSVKSFVDYRLRDGKLVRARISAVVRQQGNAWELTDLELGGRRIALRNEFPLPEKSDGSEDPFPPPGIEDYPEPEDRTVGRAVQNLAYAIDAAAKLRKTRVVWLFDVSTSAEKWRNDALGNFSPIYDQLTRHGRAVGDKPAALEMAVVAFDHETKVLTEEPTGDSDTIRQAAEELDRLELGGQRGRERPFAALKTALAKFGDLRGGYLQFVIVTEEAGDDDDATLEAAIASVARAAARVYVIGKEAPFGRAAWPKDDRFGRGGKEDDPLHQGPETPAAQRINLQFWQASFIDKTFELPSGFGPYSLARLCRQTGGTFFLCDRGGVSLTFSPGWGDGGGQVRFDPKIRGRYTPRYGSAREYQAFLASNAAAGALDAAAKQPFVDLATALRFEFSAPSEAQLTRTLGEAQKGVARLSPKLDAIYDVLKPGEKARDKLTAPRWQAGFDLAMGRILAVKSRVEGYNSMLANLKGGQKFKNPNSSTWVLKPADTISAGSKYERLLRDANRYLERVIKDHPGTPWAHLAKRELSAKLGWEWGER